nr:hypothetical protein [Limnoraphis robusta]
MVLLSLLMLTLLTGPLCPVRVRISSPVSRFQTLMVLSELPETMVLLSLLMLTLKT